MAENDLDSGQPEGTQDTPKSEGSQGKGVSGSSFDAAKLQSTLETALRRMDEIDHAYKTFQSGKDRGAETAKKFNDEVSELKRKVAEIEKLKSSGLELDDAVEEFDFRESVRQMKEQLGKINPVRENPAGNGGFAADEATRLIEKVGLEINSAEAVQLLRGDYENMDRFELEARRLKDRLANAPKPTPETTSTIGGGRVEAGDLRKEFDEKAKTLRGNALIDLKMEFRKRGLDIS